MSSRFARPVIAVVGAGFSGALTALNLLQAPGSVARVLLIEAAERFGVGAAFGAAEAGHLLNVRAENMSADPDRPEDFMLWLAERHGRPPDPFTFASRPEYGAYVQERLRHAAQSGAAADRLLLIQDRVTAVERDGDGFRVRLDMGRSLGADAVVLATGNAPPSVAALPDPAFAASGAYVGSPWSPGALDAVGGQDPVLLIGTGLTMIDVMASLDARGHFGPVTALSRRGLLPHAHAPRSHAPGAPWRRRPGEPLSQALKRFRRDAAADGDWRRRFDSLRPVTQALWKSLGDDERGRFLRHLRPWWDIHRHRLAPRMALRLQAWQAGRLNVVAGRLLELRAQGGEAQGGEVLAVWRPRGEAGGRSLAVRWVVNCTGPEGDATRLTDPMTQGLLAQGLARPDPHRLGLDVDDGGRLIDAEGRPQDRLFAIGPIARGALWEIAAVPDIRVEARRLGRLLAALGPADRATPQTQAAE